jgi:hypothetical protein
MQICTMGLTNPAKYFFKHHRGPPIAARPDGRGDPNLIEPLFACTLFFGLQ